MPKIVQLQSPNRPRATIGQMRDEVQVQTYGDAPFGEYSLKRTYTTIATVRARIVNIAGSGSREGKGIDANITHTVVIRKPEFELTTENMLEWTHPGTNEHLRPRQVRPVGRTSSDPREQFVMILCESMGLVDAFKDPSPTVSDITVSGLTGENAVDNGLYENAGIVDGRTQWKSGTKTIEWAGSWEFTGLSYAEENTADTLMPPKTGWPVGSAGTAPILAY